MEKDGEIEALSMPMLKEEINGRQSNNEDFFVLVSQVIKDFKRAGKFGNAKIYASLKNKIEKFHGTKSLPFRQINYAFLKRLETEHYASGSGAGGLSVYLRTLRALYLSLIHI